MQGCTFTKKIKTFPEPIFERNSFILSEKNFLSLLEKFMQFSDGKSFTKSQILENFPGPKKAYFGK